MICEVAPNYILPPACLCFDLGPQPGCPLYEPDREQFGITYPKEFFSLQLLNNL